MQVNKLSDSSTKINFSVIAEKNELSSYLDNVLTQFSKTISVAGFRKGHVPNSVVEKNIDQSTLQTEFLDFALNELYLDAIKKLDVAPTDRPNVSIKKFVPFEVLEVVFEVEKISEIKLPSIEKLTTRRKIIKVSDKDIDRVVEDLIDNNSERISSKTAAKLNDEVIFDFEGIDEKTKKAISGAKSENYPLILGSKSFIPGFEEELVGLKAGDFKEFTITFPADYHQA